MTSAVMLQYLLSWRTATLLLVLFNLKSLPFAWHVRLLYRLVRFWYTPQRVQQALREAAKKGTVHPIFDFVSIYSRAPAFETDYNMHKSNATYFSDLDESRTALMTKLYMPGMRIGSKQLEAAGYPGNISIILGSVHTSFHKEIKPYERYEIRSRILGWDRKWIVIGTFFVRPAKGTRGEVLLASSLSKYVTKKGRYTVAPERCLNAAGWLPEPPELTRTADNQNAEDSNSSANTVIPIKPERTPPPAQGGENSIAAPAPETAVNAPVVDRLEDMATRIGDDSRTIDISAAEPPRAEEWDWCRIEMERLRGLGIAQHWLDLDKKLMNEFGVAEEQK
jgi:acyl-CoA thioesterase FadM